MCHIDYLIFFSLADVVLNKITTTANRRSCTWGLWILVKLLDIDENHRYNICTWNHHRNGRLFEWTNWRSPYNIYNVIHKTSHSQISPYGTYAKMDYAVSNYINKIITVVRYATLFPYTKILLYLLSVIFCNAVFHK